MSARGLWLFGASVLALGLSSCSVEPAPAAAPVYPADCRGLAEGATFDCTEQRFWTAFQQPAIEPRRDSEAMLMRTVAAFPAPTNKVGMSRVRFRLGQIRLAMALENGQSDFMLKASELIIGEFDKAMELDPSNGIIAPWKDTMDMAIFAVLGDWDAAVPLAERGFENVAKSPMGNTLSLSGTTIGFPLSTKVPQRTVALLDVWKCEGPDFCKQNTAHSPWARPGLAFHFAEAYARVGNREKAKQYLDEALAAAGAKEWPYRNVAEAASKDLDGFLGKFAARGEDKGAFDIAYANQPWGCLFCHEKR